ncbi:aromatic ring-hydroxylating dioxygenase subunit alpha [Roseovarius sp. SCSIO 43702]|uniref:aromatic ring-hydroxylating oxygenase subunit alpha n=1 Tax=Roseovarius sp. SCSIO 43702 TaxID=2823043 RepID=UPI001C7324E2|nr:aromatic ring-hydroxylating dioxygenase subunit alpha [Roseovarius sp. SCSIO 43702]QYX57532.1 aromatic ring-hydroxylating dioxygenase subunit alpha [Roseovarius sp. SCSIO 43702]
MTRHDNSAFAKDRDRSGLPKWSFFSKELLEAEKDLLFRRHWQIVCHISDIPEPGDFVTFDIAGERALVIRDREGEVRAFHNLCRHRGSRVVAEETGRCRSAIICPFHGWVYNLDGTLRGASQPKSLPDLDPEEWSLKTIEMDTWQGFIFVRFQPGPQRPISEILARHDAEVSQYRLDTIAPSGAGFWTEHIDANWKCVRDVDNEGYHVPMAHPGLHDLYGNGYHDEPFHDGTSRSFGSFREGQGRHWSVRHYKSILEAPSRLDEDHAGAWLYIGIFPNFVIGFYPDSVMFYQEYPTSVGTCLQRSATYRYPDEDRRLRLARYLSGRIDRITSDEDTQLIEWTWEAAFSSGYDGIILSDLEIGVQSYHDELRRHFPILRSTEEPPEGTLLARNAALLQEAK